MSCIHIDGAQACIICLFDATYWCSVALHVSRPNRFPAMSPATWFYYLSCHLNGSPSATHHTINGAISGKYSFGKYNIFQGRDEAMLSVMVKACLQINIPLLFRTLDNFVFLYDCIPLVLSRLKYCVKRKIMFFIVCY